MHLLSIVSIGCGFLLLPFLAPSSPEATTPPGGRYIGAAMCKNCHNGADKGNAYDHWMGTPHAKAFENLASDKAKEAAKKLGIDDPQKSEKCLKCHVTAYGVDKKEIKVSFKPEHGVQCEACHGPSSLHVNDPHAYRPAISRDSQDCRQCHMSGDLVAADGFIQHSDGNYGDLFPGKHAVLDCVDCHDPHAGVVAPRAARQTFLRATCDGCHWQQARVQKPVHRIRVTCDDCHMPAMIQVASSNPDIFQGDMPTHQVVINAEQIGQFAEDGSILPQIGLDFACRQCHTPQGIGPALSDAVLLDVAQDYHTPQTAAAATTPGTEGAPTPAAAATAQP